VGRGIPFLKAYRKRKAWKKGGSLLVGQKATAQRKKIGGKGGGGSIGVENDVCDQEGV